MGKLEYKIQLSLHGSYILKGSIPLAIVIYLAWSSPVARISVGERKGEYRDDLGRSINLPGELPPEQYPYQHPSGSGGALPSNQSYSRRGARQGAFDEEQPQ